MYYFDTRDQKVIFVDDAKEGINSSYVRIGKGMNAMRCALYEPIKPDSRAHTAVIVVHSDGDYSVFPIGRELARKGFRTLCGQVADPHSELDEKILDIGAAVQFLKKLPGVRHIVLLGHSGGATLMSAYQAIAEEGADYFRQKQFFYPCTIHEKLLPADGMMLLDSNWGNGAMTLLSVDPAVVEEGNGRILNEEFNIFSPANGYQKGNTHYQPEFMKKYSAAQAERNNKLIMTALSKLKNIENGTGNYIDDEPMIIAGGAQFAPCNKLIPEDIHLVSHTKDQYPLIHSDGSQSKEIIHSVRRAALFDQNPTPSIDACCYGTIRDYLSNRAVFAGHDYAVTETGIDGIQWENTYNCTPGNISHVKQIPLLIMGMTGSYEYLASEVIYRNAQSADKEIYFVEGASHNFTPAKEAECVSGQYNGTDQTVFQTAADWLSRHFDKEGA